MQEKCIIGHKLRHKCQLGCEVSNIEFYRFFVFTNNQKGFCTLWMDWHTKDRRRVTKIVIKCVRKVPLLNQNIWEVFEWNRSWINDYLAGQKWFWKFILYLNSTIWMGSPWKITPVRQNKAREIGGQRGQWSSYLK